MKAKRTNSPHSNRTCAVRALLSALCVTIALLVCGMYWGVGDVYNDSNDNCANCRNAEYGKRASVVGKNIQVVEYALAEDGDTNETMYEYLFDWYNLQYDGNHNIWTDTNGTFHTWDTSQEYNFDQWQNWYFGFVNGIFGIEGAPGDTATIQDLIDVIKTDYIVGIYRFLYYQLRHIDSTIYNVQCAAEEIGLILEDLSGYLKNNVSKIVTNTNKLSELTDIDDGITSLGTKMETVKTSLSTIVTNTSDTVSRLALLSNGQTRILTAMGDANSYLSSIVTNTSNAASKLDNVYTRMGSILSDTSTISDYIDLLTADVGSIYELLQEGTGSGGTVNVDMSGVLRKLDMIIDLMIVDQSNVLDDLIGDFDKVAFAASAGTLSNALRSVFPFCLVAVAIDVAQLFNQEPITPDFKIMIPAIGGEMLPMNVQMSGFEPLRNISGFICYLGVVMSLIFGTRKVLFGGGSQ